jgi:hypothetical protein
MKTITVSLALAAAAFAQERRVEVRTGPNAGFADFGRNQTFEFVNGQMIGGKAVKGAPYSAEAVTESTQTLADGNKIVHKSSSMMYRDSEGRERREESFEKLGNWNAQGEPAKAIFISDPVAKTSYSLDTKAHTARKNSDPMITTFSHSTEGRTESGAIVRTFSSSTSSSSASTSAPLPEPPPFIAEHGAGIPGGGVIMFDRMVTPGGDKANTKTDDLGKRMIEGVQAEGTRTTITIPAGQMGNERPIEIVSERWYSPDLQMTVMSKHSDPRMGETVYKLTNVNRSEPMRSLFEIPADYTISDSPAMMRLRTPRKEDQ